MPAMETTGELPRSATARRATVPAAPKLRDSCHACAASKVKCNKEKPTCARCAKRGLTCEYFVTKRTGRKRDTRPAETTNVTQAPPPPPPQQQPNPPISEPLILTSPNFLAPSPRQPTSTYPDILPNLLSPTEPGLNSTLTSTEFDDFFASPISFPVLEPSDPDSFLPHHSDSRSINSAFLDSNGPGSLVIPEDAFSVLDEAAAEFPPLPKPRSPPNSRDSNITGDLHSFQGFRSEPCCCLIRALGLLKQLFPNASTACTRSSPGFDNGTRQLLTIQAVVAENEQTIEAISSMLQCPCSQDGYLLTIMSLIVFKVLGWYAAAARETPMGCDGSHSPIKAYNGRERTSSCHPEQVLQSPTIVGGYCIEGEDQGRMAAQLVLSELHRVQRFVNQLSQRLKGHQSHKAGFATPDSVPPFSDAFSDGESTLPFSPNMFDQLEADLRKRLRALSVEIVDMLRRG